MNTKFIKYGSALLLSVCLSLTGCVDLDVAPTNKYTDATYWTTESRASSVLNMAYRQMFTSDCYFNNEILSDNVYVGYGSKDEKFIAIGLADASTGRFSNEWNDCYGGIKTCHTFLANVHRVPEMDQKLRSRMESEIRFIRASLYLRMTTWYGDIPFFTEDITFEQSKTIPRTSQETVMTWIHEELNAISDSLPTRQQYAKEDRGRITSGAAIALNARAYLYENNWQGVKECCEKLLSGKYGNYGLFPNYEQLFWYDNKYNEEMVLDLQFVPIVRTWGNLGVFAPMSTEASLCQAGPTQGLVDSYLMKNGEKWTANDPDYTDRDPRMGATIAYDGSSWIDREGKEYKINIHPEKESIPGKRSDKYSGQGSAQTPTGYYYRKLCDPNPKAYKSGWESSLNLPLIRWADVLLMYAEAKFELGEMDKTVWDATIRPLRVRAGFDNTPKALDFPGVSTEAMREIVRNERRCELALEGLRIFDIRRWKTAEIVLKQAPRGAKFEKKVDTYEYIKLTPGNFSRDRDYLWPIPRRERNLNKNLTQNPGY